MLAVIDESGDPGFALGSTPYFVVVMVVFDSFSDAEAVAKSVIAAKQTCRIRRELKFNGSNDKARTGFLQAIGACPFRVRSVVIDKRVIRDQEIRKDSKELAFYAVRHLIASAHPALAPGTVIKIDRYGDKGVRDALATYLRQHLPQGLIKSVKFVDSRNDVLIQLADMVAGAMARPYNAPNSKTPSRWREMLAAHVEEEIIVEM